VGVDNNQSNPNKVTIDTVLRDGDRLTVTPTNVQGEYCGPKLSAVKRFLKSIGFAYEKSGPGDHETWRHSDGRKLQLNPAREKQYVDKACIRAIAEALNCTLGEADRDIRNT
jgi:hypothetical protein